jgi:hypothetical protein
VLDRLLGRLIEECESFGLATTMVIPSGFALDVQGAAFGEGFRGVDFVISGRARITARQDRTASRLGQPCYFMGGLGDL